MPLAGRAGRRTLALELVAASMAVLFQELALIRWLPAQVRVLGYFPNLILVSAFLGLGLGCLRAGRRSLLWLWPVSLAVLTGTAAALSRIIFTHEAASEHLFLLYYDLPRDAYAVGDIRPPIVLFFVLSAVSFVPLGQIVAERLRRFGELRDPLAGYCWDIGGSILGIAAFTAFSFLGTFPVTWFTGLALLGALFFRRKRAALLYLPLAALSVLTVSLTERAEQYSPYYALRIDPYGGGYGSAILANGALHQFAMGLESSRALPELLHQQRDGYQIPYRLMAHVPRHALVIGAGSGNDVAVLLELGAERVDAVEIDPGILEIGRRVHPSRPYASPRVRTFNTDARTFLNNSGETYDLIVFGTLDSMTRLSALSSVRLDNFVYTREALEAARRRLRPEGGLVLYFMAGTEYIDLRLAALVTAAFDERPLVVSHSGLFNRVYMVGPPFEAQGGGQRRAAAAPFLAAATARTELPSDDWPYLYLARRGVTAFYAEVGLVLLLLSVAAVLWASPDMRRSVRSGMDVEMFLLGLGFLLLEAGSITHMNLVWGATWLTSAVVFLSVLAMILLAALFVRARPPRFEAALAAFAACALAAYLAPTEWAMLPSWPARLLASVVLVGAPIVFASMCFTVLLATRAAPDQAFGWNVLGAVAGGILEIGSMAVGLRALILVALAAYLCVFLVRRRRGGAPARATATA